MVASIIGQGTCLHCGGPTNLRKGFTVKFCCSRCSDAWHLKNNPIRREKFLARVREYNGRRRERRKLLMAFALDAVALMQHERAIQCGRIRTTDSG